MTHTLWSIEIWLSVAVPFCTMMYVISGRCPILHTDRPSNMSAVRGRLSCHLRSVIRLYGMSPCGSCWSYYLGTFSPLLTHWPPGRFWWHFRWVIFKLILVIDGCVISCEIVVRWMLLDLTYDKSTLVQVMAWCCQAASRYLSQCWPRSLLP